MRLIDADALKKRAAMHGHAVRPLVTAYHMCVSVKDIDNAPTIDPATQWIPVTERLPDEFVSVLGYMTDAGEFPPVRECYLVGRAFFFPALKDRHPVSHWMEMPKPPVCEIKEYVESCEECGFCEMTEAHHEN